MSGDYEVSTFQKKPAYRYIRKTDNLPTVREAAHRGVNAPAMVKVFNPTGGQTWYIAGYDPDTREAWGMVDLGWGPELGSFDMAELVAIRGRFNLPLERDVWWTPKPIKSLPGMEE